MLDSVRTLLRRSGSVRVIGAGGDPDDRSRRGLLQALAVCGASAPALYLLGGLPVAGAATVPGTIAIADDPVPLAVESEIRIVRDFANPMLELLRLLRDASEIEQALMLQYLYAAFSIKPRYAALIGDGTPNATTLLGVAIQEMQHLSVVNGFMVAIGGAPNLMPQEFPFDPDIYPFAFNMEPLSRANLAKYVYAEAPPGLLDWKLPKDEDVTFVDNVRALIGAEDRVNHLGSLYIRIIAVTRELAAAAMPGLPDFAPWIEQLEAVMEQGEVAHYQFFRSVFMGTHKAFAGRATIWELPPLDPDYPAMPLAINPSAYVGHPNQIRNPTALSLAWLGNLHYWIILCLLDLHFRENSSLMLSLAEMHMQGALWSLARHLPVYGVGMPFDAFGPGYAAGSNAAHNRRIILCLLDEAHQLEAKLHGKLPADFPSGIVAKTETALRDRA